MRITSSELVLVMCLFVSLFWGFNRSTNLPSDILTLQKHTKIINTRGKKVVVVFTSGPDFNSKNKWAAFIDEVLFNKLDSELSKDNYTYMVLNTTCLSNVEYDKECVNQFTSIALSIAKLSPEAVVYSGIDSGIVANSFERILKSEGIPIYAIGTEVDIDYDLYIGPNNKELGVSAYQGLSEFIEPGQEAIYVETVRLSIPADRFDNGYPRINSARLLMEAAEVETRLTIFTSWNNRKTYTEIRKELLVNGPVDYIITPSAETASGAADAVEELGYSKEIKIISLDFTEEVVQLLKEGKIYGAVSQKFEQQAIVLANYIKDNNYKKDSKKVLFASELITLDNIEDFVKDNGEILY